MHDAAVTEKIPSLGHSNGYFGESQTDLSLGTTRLSADLAQTLGWIYMKAQTGIADGALTGDLTEDGSVARFRGIPYAMPPIGELRWKPPQPSAPWQGALRATKFAPASPQPPIILETSYMYNGELHSSMGWSSEDCLYLNVYTASLDAAERRPVIVWFHTGGFNFGWSGGPLYDGSNLARAGAVVVTVTYRLGRLGFLAHPALSAESAHHASGNYGLLDQIAALKWVRDNIFAFGGDPNCVTIYGQSAGSSSVSVLMASPLASGLFHRAIGSSAGSFGPTSEGGTHFGSCFQSLAAAERCGEAYMAGRAVATATQMRALPAASLLDVDYTGQRPDFLETVYPIVDGYVLPANPYDLFVHKRHNDVPLMTGSNAAEGQGIHFYMEAQLFEKYNRELLGAEFENLQTVYPMETQQQTIVSSANFGSDRVFTWQNWTWVRLQEKFGRQAAYYYHFAYEPPIPANRYAEQALSPSLGAAHSIEVPYVWRNLQSRDWPLSAIDHQLSHTMSSYWLNFARTGNPNGAGLPEWPAFSATDPKLMLFDAKSSVQPAPVEPLRERMSFWDRAFARQFKIGAAL